MPVTRASSATPATDRVGSQSPTARRLKKVTQRLSSLKETEAPGSRPGSTPASTLASPRNEALRVITDCSEANEQTTTKPEQYAAVPAVPDNVHTAGPRPGNASSGNFQVGQHTAATKPSRQGVLPPFDDFMGSLRSYGTFTGAASSSQQPTHHQAPSYGEWKAQVQRLQHQYTPKQHRVPPSQTGPSITQGSSAPSAATPSLLDSRYTKAFEHLRAALASRLSDRETDSVETIARFHSVDKELRLLAHYSGHTIDVNAIYSQQLQMQAVYFFAVAFPRLSFVEVAVELHISAKLLQQWITHYCRAFSIVIPRL